MKDFIRKNTRFSLCGLNCALCTMHLDGYCPGCGGGPGNQSCKIARCSLQHNKVSYCFECSSFPCGFYEKAEEYDSFITHRNQLDDLARAKDMGIEQYMCELDEKAEILKFLLEHYNDGRRKTFFCTAVNILELSDIRMIMQKLNDNSRLSILSQKERSAFAVSLFQDLAAQHDIVLKLRKKPKNR